MAVTVFFDGDCPLCRREIALMKRLDRRSRIEFLDISGDTTAACPVDRKTMLERFHVMDNGQLRSGAAAFAAMWRQIPLLWPLGQFARIPPVTWLLERSYRGFLALRPKLQALLR